MALGGGMHFHIPRFDWFERLENDNTYAYNHWSLTSYSQRCRDVTHEQNNYINCLFFLSS